MTEKEKKEVIRRALSAERALIIRDCREILALPAVTREQRMWATYVIELLESPLTDEELKAMSFPKNAQKS